jgi:PilZ domain
MDGMLIGEERRLDPRFDFSERLSFSTTAPANQWVRSDPVIVRSEERPLARIINISGRGCCLVLNRPLDKFQIIKLDFPLYHTGLTIPTLAEVCWVFIEPDLNRYLAGLRYIL